MQSNANYPIGGIIALVHQNAGLENPPAEVEERLVSALTPYRHGITESQLGMVADTLEKRAARFKQQNNTQEASVLLDAVGVLEEAQGAIIEGELGGVKTRAYTGQSLGGAAVHEARLASHDEIRSTSEVDPEKKKRGAAAEAEQGQRQWPDISGPKTPLPEGAVPMNDLLRHWGHEKGFLQSLEVHIRSSIAPEQGRWQEVSIAGQPPLEDGTIIKAGYFTAGMSAHAKLCIEGESCAQHLMPILKEGQQQKDDAAKARNDKKLNAAKRRDYRGLTLLFETARATSVRSALLREVEALPEHTARESDGSVSIHPYGHTIKVLVMISEKGKQRVMIHKDCIDAVERFAAKLPRESGKKVSGRFDTNTSGTQVSLQAEEKEADAPIDVAIAEPVDTPEVCELLPLTQEQPLAAVGNDECPTTQIDATTANPKARAKKKPAAKTEPTHKPFDASWKKLQTFAAEAKMDADGITIFIADGPQQAINLKPEEFKRKCAAAKTMLSQVGVKDPRASELIDALVTAFDSHHENRQLGGSTPD